MDVRPVVPDDEQQDFDVDIARDDDDGTITIKGLPPGFTIAALGFIAMKDHTYVKSGSWGEPDTIRAVEIPWLLDTWAALFDAALENNGFRILRRT